MRKVIIDSNLLFLLIIGTGGREEIGYWKKRLSAYSEDDFDRLVYFIAPYDSLVLLPNTLTEISNLIGDAQDHRTTRARDALKAIIDTSAEIYMPSIGVVARKEFEWLGLSDTAQLQAAERDNHLLLTADGPLHAAALQRGVQAVHFSAL